jgi:outer membrane protein assembly factor BamB
MAASLAILVGALAPPDATCLAGYSVQGACEAWRDRYDSPWPDAPPRHDSAVDVAVSPLGSQVFVAATTPGPHGDFDATVWALDGGTGHRQWVRRIDGGAQADDAAIRLVASPDGAVLFLAANLHGAPNRREAAVVALDTLDGTVRWQRTVDASTGHNDARMLVITPPGDVLYLAGTADARTAAARIFASAFRATDGDLLWTRTVTARGSAVAVGATLDAGASTLFVADPRRVHAFRAADGDVQWATDAVGVHHLFGPNALAAGPAAGLFGITTTLPEWDFVLTRYDSGTGDRVWTATFDDVAISNSAESAWSLAVSSTRPHVYVTGLGTGTTGDDDFLTVAFDQDTGGVLWTARLNGSPFAFDDPLAGAILSPDGERLYVAGTSSGNVAQFLIAAYEADTGEEAWRLAFADDEDPVLADEVLALAVHPSSTFVYASGAWGSDVLTVALPRDLRVRSFDLLV